ncbi:MAG TPA: hypothetical protein VFR67_12780 [Pilimelia sp.]|nr:hypothetical protein [Pilimelia sp.]
MTPDDGTFVGYWARRSRSTLEGVATSLGRVSPHTVTDGEEAQYLDACVGEAQEWLGTELTAYIAGAGVPADLADWVLTADAPPASGAARRLRTATEVIELFDAAGQGTLAQAWLREVSGHTAGRGPAEMIRHARTEQELDEVREAAARYLRTNGS